MKRRHVKSRKQLLAKRTSAARWLHTASPYPWPVERSPRPGDDTARRPRADRSTAVGSAGTDLSIRADRPTVHPAASYLARLALGSRRAQAAACETLARMASGNRAGAAELAWALLGYAETANLRAALIARYQPATVNRHLSALRGVLKETWRLGLMEEARYRKAIDVASVRASELLAGRAVTWDELRRLFAAVRADTTARGIRDRALLACLSAGGLRRHELVRLDRERCRALPAVRVHGKGGRERVVILPAWAARGLAEWMAIAGQTAAQSVFLRFTRDGVLTDRVLGVRGVAKILRRRAREAQVDDCAPHDFRRAYATKLLSRGVDPLVVARLMGHRDVRTTMRYDRRGVVALTEAAARLEEP